MKYTKHHEPLSTAKAVTGLLILGIAFVLFWKFMTNQEFFLEDPETMKNYIIFTITVCGFLVGLLYLSSHTIHKVKAPTKTNTSKAKKKKK